MKRQPSANFYFNAHPLSLMRGVSTHVNTQVRRGRESAVAAVTQPHKADVGVLVTTSCSHYVFHSCSCLLCCICACKDKKKKTIFTSTRCFRHKSDFMHNPDGFWKHQWDLVWISDYNTCKADRYIMSGGPELLYCTSAIIECLLSNQNALVRAICGINGDIF